MNFRYFITVAVFVLLASRSEAQKYGCTDRLAVNYDRSATINDGSCRYNPANIEPLASLNLDRILTETSGLIFWENQLWTHNDNTDTNIYALDTLYGRIVKAYPLSRITNTDWEEISQDGDYIYIGDIGNNSGNRDDLKIYRAGKNSILNNSAVFDSVCFIYSDQTDFTPNDYNNDFDCEAFIVSKDSIYLFTKQWVSNGTRVYSLPKIPGNYVAKPRSSFNVDGLITGAVYLEEKRIIVLSGYSERLKPFIYLLYDFIGSDFFSGNKRKIDVLLPFHQIEGIATTNGTKYFVTNEYFSLAPIIKTPQKIHLLDLRPFLGDYLNLPVPHPDVENNFIVSPVPAHEFVTIQSLTDLLPADYVLMNLSGQIVKTGRLNSENSTVNISGLNSGIYFIRIGEERRHSYKIVKE
jgi:Secretion system C-terminal sorting domain